MGTIERMIEQAGYEKKSDSSSGLYVAGGIVALLIALVIVVSIPDLQRYMKIRAM